MPDAVPAAGNDETDDVGVVADVSAEFVERECPGLEFRFDNKVLCACNISINSTPTE